MYVLSFSKQAQQELLEMNPPFRAMIVGYLKKQVENKAAPFFDGHRISNNESEWFFDFGIRRIMAYIDANEVIILGFLLTEHRDTQYYLDHPDAWDTKYNYGEKQLYNPLEPRY